MKKANIGIQTFFFIMMAVLMIWIMVFGIQKMFFVSEFLNDEERLEIKAELKNAFDDCEDPLNKGSFNTIYIKNSKFNSVCLIGADNINSYPEEFKSLLIVGENVALVDADFHYNITDDIVVENIQVIDAIKIDTDFINSTCFYKDKNTDEVSVKITCT